MNVIARWVDRTMQRVAINIGELLDCALLTTPEENRRDDDI